MMKMSKRSELKTLLRCRLAKTQFSDRYQTIRYTLLKNKKETDCVAKINTMG